MLETSTQHWVDCENVLGQVKKDYAYERVEIVCSKIVALKNQF